MNNAVNIAKLTEFLSFQGFHTSLNTMTSLPNLTFSQHVPFCREVNPIMPISLQNFLSRKQISLKKIIHTAAVSIYENPSVSEYQLYTSISDVTKMFTENKANKMKCKTFIVSSAAFHVYCLSL